MTGGDKGKRILIHLSSSSSDDGDAVPDDEIDVMSSSTGDESESIEDDDDDYGCSEEDDGDYGGGDDDCGSSEGDGSDDGDEYDNRCEEAGDDEQALFNRVLHFLREKRDLHELSLNACKSYLRRHGLRVSGNKDVCVQRVLEHWRVKDGEAEVLYPRSSFNINCKGDVCRGDIVLFTQKVYGSFDKVTRNGNLQGKRTIAGRVVKESYGAAKQQHTFTVEVLWSKGVKKLAPLSPLLVKGRNLYRLKTYRQPWKNEGERRKVLAEKHRRGTAARLKRDKRKKVCSGKGSKSQKACHGARSSEMSSREFKDFRREQGVSTSRHSTTNRSSHQNTPVQRATIHTAKTTYSKPCIKHQNNMLWTSHTASRIHQKPPDEYHFSSMPLGLEATNFQPRFPYHGQMLRPPSQYNSSSHNSCHVQSPRMAHENYHQFFPSQLANGRQLHGLSRCSIQGCVGHGSNRCIIAACWRCCRREGMRCNVHR